MDPIVKLATLHVCAGVRLEKDVAAEEEAEADERERTNGLWNGQPFRQPLAAPLPECPTGCARAQPVQVCPSCLCLSSEATNQR